MQQTKHFYMLCFRETLQYPSESVAEGKLSAHCTHLLCETHAGDGDRDQQTRQQLWRDPDALPGRVETCETTAWAGCNGFGPPQYKASTVFCIFMKWFACFGFFLQTQCDLHSLIQVMKAVFSEVPPLRMCLYPEECEYSFLFIPITLHICVEQLHSWIPSYVLISSRQRINRQLT